MSTKKETVEEFLARGGTITKVEPKPIKVDPYTRTRRRKRRE